MSVTWNPKKRKRKRAHGFLSRQKKIGGRRILSKRKGKKRACLAV